MMNMTDYSMDDDKWNRNEVKVRTFMDSNDIGGMAQVIEWNLETGMTDSNNRKRYWSNITNLLGMLDNSPIRRGREPTLPDEVNQAVLDLVADYVADCETLYNNNPAYATILRQHGKSGYGVFNDATHYAETLGKTLKGALTKYFRNHEKGITTEPSWDGTIDKNGTPNIIGVVIADDDSAGEEE